MKQDWEDESSQSLVGAQASSEEGSCIATLADLVTTASRSTGHPLFRNTRGLAHIA